MSTPIVMMIIRMKLRAAAVGMSPCTRNRSWMTEPIMVFFGPPRNSALMKSPAAGMNVSRLPANTPGSDSGSTTLRNACQPLL